MIENWPTKKYSIIYADPPWSYRDKMNDRKSFQTPYKQQPNDWIFSLPVKQITNENSVLFCWITNPMLEHGINLFNAWGFKFKTVCFCWVKLTSKGNPVANLGRWTMGGMELCLLGTKGKPQRLQKNIKQVVFEKRGSHSTKPPIIRDKIVSLLGDLPRIELFARQRVDGWDAWGDEI